MLICAQLKAPATLTQVKQPLGTNLASRMQEPTADLNAVTQTEIQVRVEN
jgi:hypothetical protein